MTSETEKHIEPEADEALDAEQAFTDADGAAEGASGFAANEDLQSAADAERMAALEAENADVKDRMLRLAAEMENLRRRTEREIKDARTYAVTSFAREMLSVTDNLRRAIDAVPDEARASGENGLTALIEGVEVTERGMLASLEKFGVKRLEPEGQRFDANFHQAMFEVPNPDVPNGTVVQVVQAGYAIGDRVLRPALVGVSKGGPKQAAEPKPAEAAGDAG
ncbi:nucleotide exchange factor GrpE [Mangrovibrevibacter kandeliae]|uniref:nucleotide exchange factor GrpE n=1 Tax=Mangrovibrevibacter kandeliae TaxID=2968473 RepID=UPI002117A18B|nr:MULTISPECIES: nucleotide exchange factor GrpE [unclassified Aurantimonas]MCQ8784288.1 nucleotide exchange factor GrpE [Aurantimonas sp. CSK15Z-1]MCW4117044.1 nucleotide exchange factor GrpE [Aurantimonas sp. MSK8Z-1]